jgi:hypothetical protein
MTAGYGSATLERNAKRPFAYSGSKENETVLYGKTIGLQGRALMNDSIRKVLEIETKGAG